MARQTDWTKLAGKRVELRKGGQVVRTGFVKDVLDSADVLWLEAERFRQRTLIDKSMGFTIRPMQDPSLN
ncbi:hypothetical protein [Arthrobacter sp. AG1021]|uniref:hypothetical protein n=1 Tax=Arthrobacter sp. AG1021 TaxID=2183908 RepID=UPI0006B258D9|nr:hypothetical protein [Arthrobacter sp. AG1021]ALD65328.1 hypothetical protein AFL94_16975 [Arthrobacter sp. LS16]RKS16837.1 hypothetical protein DFO58_3395 [Arthrobacter sp. AG1021]